MFGQSLVNLIPPPFSIRQSTSLLERQKQKAKTDGVNFEDLRKKAYISLTSKIEDLGPNWSYYVPASHRRGKSQTYHIRWKG